MTKQDIHDIIYLLDDHFQSHGLEVRDALTFKFENNNPGGDYLKYNDSTLFTNYIEDEDGYLEDTELVDYIKDDLSIIYDNFNIKNYEKLYNSLKIKEKLEMEIEVANFNLKVFNILSTEFKIIEWTSLSNGLTDTVQFLKIKDSEHNENIQLKKFNQFK